MSRLTRFRVAKALVISAIALVALPAIAQAHIANATASCGSVTFNWSEFASSGSGNGGVNAPTWSVRLTPTDGTAATFTDTGSVSFSGSSDTQIVTIPAVSGSVAVSSAWTSSQTRDGDASSYSATLSVSGCSKLSPTLSTTASPSSAALGTPVADAGTLSGGYQPTGTIVWHLYGPNDTGCSASNPPSVSATVSGDGTYTSPTLTPSQAGTYHWVATYEGDANNATIGPEGCTTASESVTIAKATPSISTTATPASATVGTAVHDVASLTAGQNPTGTITWSLYGPNDATCANANAPQVTASVSGDGTYPSPTLTPSAAGTYHWVASYSGDANDAAVGPTGCSVASETVTITTAAPSITTTATPASATVGTAVHDVASLTAGQNPTGTITWSLYGPNDATCANANAPQVTASVSGDGTYPSPTLTPSAAGTYHWVASYSGDANNAAVGPTGCSVASETVTINKATPSISTTASPATATVGALLADVATVSGGNDPTGSITWSLYGPTDASCSNANPPQVVATVHGDGTYTSPQLTPNQGGTYRWVATYTGDANNNGVGPIGCTDPAESATLAKATPAITTTATPSSQTVSGQITDVAHVTGGASPTGSITWALYGPADDSCAASSPPTVTSPVSGDGTYPSPPLAPSAAGTYHWVLTYSGDAANNAVGPIGCADPNETATITAVPSATFTIVKEQSIDGGAFVTTPVDGQPGETLQYRIIVSNTGSAALTLSAFSDPNCDAGTIAGGPNGPLTATQTAIWTCSHLLTTADQAAGSYSNTATVTGTVPGGTPSTPTSNTVVAYLTGPPSLAIVKQQLDVTSDPSGAFTSGTLTGNVGDTIDYQIQVTNTGGEPLRLVFSDPNCDAGTLSGPTGGNFDASGDLAPASTTTYRCTHQLQASDTPAYTNTASVIGTPTIGTPVGPYTSTVITNIAPQPGPGPAPTPTPTPTPTPSVTPTPTPTPTTAITPRPGLRVVKSQEIAGSASGFTTSPITVSPGQTIDYRITVTNTGNVALRLSADDAHCGPGTLRGPAPAVAPSQGLQPGGVVVYNCSRKIIASDAPAFTNTASVTGTPISGKPTTTKTSTVVANVALAAVKACTARTNGSARLTKSAAAPGKPFTAVVHGAKISAVTFYVDARVYKTLRTPNAAGGGYAVTINPAAMSFGTHELSAHVTVTCGGTLKASTPFTHPAPQHAVTPQFTG